MYLSLTLAAKLVNVLEQADSDTLILGTSSGGLGASLQHRDDGVGVVGAGVAATKGNSTQARKACWPSAQRGACHWISGSEEAS